MRKRKREEGAEGRRRGGEEKKGKKKEKEKGRDKEARGSAKRGILSLWLPLSA